MIRYQVLLRVEILIVLIANCKMSIANCGLLFYDFLSDNIFSNVNWSCGFADFGQFRAVDGCANEHANAADEYSICDSYEVREGACHEVAERDHTEESHSIETHDASAFVVIDERLKNCIAGS